MYLCHTAFERSLARVAIAFGRDRSTVAHACHAIEDRREDPHFDDWIDALEGRCCAKRRSARRSIGARHERTRRIERALARLAAPSAELAPERDGASFGVFPHGDRRRRPIVRLSAAEVRALEAEGAIAALTDGGVFVLSEAGRARVRRDAAADGEAFSPSTRRS